MYWACRRVLSPRVVDSRVDPFPAAQVGNGHFPTESFQNDPELLLRCVALRTHCHEGLSLANPLLSLLRYFGSAVLGHDYVPSPGIYPRRLTTADLSLIPGPKSTLLLLMANNAIVYSALF